MTPGLPVPQVTTDLLSRGGKDIAFASYGPLWKFQRKLVHAALSMFGEGSLALERISKWPPPAPRLPPSSVSLPRLIQARLFLSLCPDPLGSPERDSLAQPNPPSTPPVCLAGAQLLSCHPQYFTDTSPHAFSALSFSSPHR